MTDNELKEVYGNYTKDITKLYTGTAGFINKNEVGDLFMVLLGNIIGCLCVALLARVIGFPVIFLGCVRLG